MDIDLSVMLSYQSYQQAKESGEWLLLLAAIDPATGAVTTVDIQMNQSALMEMSVKEQMRRIVEPALIAMRERLIKRGEYIWTTDLGANSVPHTGE